MLTFLRSALFLIAFLIWSTIVHVLAIPAFILPRLVTVNISRYWGRGTILLLKIICGIDFEVRGKKPPQGSLIAAKHMSLWDTLALYWILYDPVVVLKRELLFVPLYGWYTWKAGMIFVDRNGGMKSMRKLGREAAHVLAQRRSLLIFPEGTRKKPGAAPDYKPGIAGLYAQLAVPCYPAALNSGAHWSGFWKYPGTIVLEFLEPIPADLKRTAFMQELENKIETATSRLLVAG
jgi:1-acyl-sn-glycerol-3-phosphate acyltransferase